MQYTAVKLRKSFQNAIFLFFIYNDIVLFYAYPVFYKRLAVYLERRSNGLLQSFTLPIPTPIVTLAITYSELTYSDSQPLVYLYKLFPVPSGLLESTLNLSSVLLPSCFLLSTFFLPSSYLLPTHYFVFPKRIFSAQFITNSKLSIFKFQISQNCINICFVEPFPLLSSCYPLAIGLLPSTFPLPCIYSAYTFDVSWMYLGCTLDVPWMYLAAILYLPKE